MIEKISQETPVTSSRHFSSTIKSLTCMQPIPTFYVEVHFQETIPSFSLIN